MPEGWLGSCYSPVWKVMAGWDSIDVSNIARFGYIGVVDTNEEVFP
jgi:hypothetical protein